MLYNSLCYLKIGQQFHYLREFPIRVTKMLIKSVIYALHDFVGPCNKLMASQDSLAATIGPMPFSSPKVMENGDHFVVLYRRAQTIIISGKFYHQYFGKIFIISIFGEIFIIRNFGKIFIISIFGEICIISIFGEIFIISIFGEIFIINIFGEIFIISIFGKFLSSAFRRNFYHQHFRGNFYRQHFRENIYHQHFLGNFLSTLGKIYKITLWILKNKGRKEIYQPRKK